MVMLIRCGCAMLLLLAVTALAIGGVKCISNGGVGATAAAVPSVTAEQTAPEDEVAASEQTRAPLQNSEGRRAKALRFFPDDEDATSQHQSNRIDGRQQYVVHSSYEASETGLNDGSQPFKFSNAMRPTSSYVQAAEPAQVSGQFYSPAQQRQQYESQPHPPSNDIYYGSAQTFNAPRPPPGNYYAQNYNYAAQPHAQQTYARPPFARPPPPPPPPNIAGPYPQTPLQRPPFRPPAYVQRPQAPPSPPQYAGNYNYQQAGQAQAPDGSISLTALLSTLGQSATNLIAGNAPPQFPQYASNGQPLAAVSANPLNRFGKAVEEITRHDDLQCIPKIICQMVGAQRRQQNGQGSGLLGSPVFSSLISAVPSTSSGLVYGRAALLGYTAGEDRCAGAYPKCPRNEDNLLYYLNNHRGGFFRFFNGGSAFGDFGGLLQQPPVVATPAYNQQQTQFAQKYPLYSQQNYQPQQQPQYQQQQQHQAASYQQQQDSTQTNLAFLTGLADAINSSGGINLSNLGANAGVLGQLASFVGSMTGLGGGDQGGGVGSMFSNLLTGFVGERFSSRRISKRSVSDAAQQPTAPAMNATSADLDPLMSLEKEMPHVKETASKKRNLNTEMRTAAEAEAESRETNETIGADEKDTLKNYGVADQPDEEEILAEDDNDTDAAPDTAPETRILNSSDNLIDEPEGRILNRKPARYQLHLNMVNFPTQTVVGHRYEKKIRFTDRPHQNSVVLPERNNDVFVFKTNYVETRPEPVTTTNGGGDVFRFPENPINAFHRDSKRIKFEQTGGEQQVQRPFRGYGDSDDVADHRIRMVFPDRTGTGNLKFDSAEFDAPQPPNARPPVRFGRILSGMRPQPANEYANNNQNDNYNNNNQQYQQTNYVTSRPPQTYNNGYEQQQPQQQQYEDYTRYPPLKRASIADHDYDYNHRSSTPKSIADSSQNIYVTNGKGVVEYYINAVGKKVYV